MNLFHIILFGPVALALLGFALLIKWAALAPYRAWQNVQDMRGMHMDIKTE